MNARSSQRAGFLERALMATFAAHGLAMVSMALVLLPGMPGGGVADEMARIQYISAHPWLWRLGWLPWQLTALSDVVLAVALLRARFVPRLPAVLTTLATAAAVVPDQAAQAAWITRGVALAASDPVAYLAYEHRIFLWMAAWAAVLYTVAALGWTWCFAAVRDGGPRPWTRVLTVLSVVLWPLFSFAGLAPFFDVSPPLVAAANGAGFLLLQVWLVLVTEAVMRRSRPDQSWGRWAPWRHPAGGRGVAGWLLETLAQSRVLRAWVGLLPSVPLRSDIRDVVYVNYIVAADRLALLVPAGLELQRLGPDGTRALFTFLTYRHGAFGPRFLGPLRRLLPSPVQSNWRIHVRDPRTGLRGVHFVSTAIDAAPHALAGRLLVDGMPMHLLRAATLVERDGAFHLRLDPGLGSGPDAAAVLRRTEVGPPQDGPWRACFDSWADFLAYAVPQDRAFSTEPWRGSVTRLEIDLGIAPGACRPLAVAGSVDSAVVRAIAGDEAQPFAFWAPAAAFVFVREAHDPLPVADQRSD